MPVFLVFLFGLFEIGHVLLVKHMLAGAARSAARHGTTEGVDNDGVQAVLLAYLDATVDAEHVTVSIKDASMFDTGGELPENQDDWDELADVDVDSLDTRDLFAVRATIPFSEVVYLPLPFTDGIMLEGTSVLRHE